MIWENDPSINTVYGSTQPNVYVGYFPEDEQTHWTVRLAPELPGTLNGILTSFRLFELVLDIQKTIGDMERVGLARRKMLRYITPATNENLLYVSTTESTNSADIKGFLDQCQDVGFELLIFSFLSGFNMEANDSKTIAFYQDVIQYGNSKGIEVGGYDLIMEDRTYGGVSIFHDYYSTYIKNTKPHRW